MGDYIIAAALAITSLTVMLWLTVPVMVEIAKHQAKKMPSAAATAEGE